MPKQPAAEIQLQLNIPKPISIGNLLVCLNMQSDFSLFLSPPAHVRTPNSLCMLAAHCGQLRIKILQLRMDSCGSFNSLETEHSSSNQRIALSHTQSATRLGTLWLHLYF